MLGTLWAQGKLIPVHPRSQVEGCLITTLLKSERVVAMLPLLSSMATTPSTITLLQGTTAL